jgi:hypothetical protein
MRALRLDAVLHAVLLAALAGACVEEQRYVVENAAFAMTADAEPAFVNDDDDELFIVTRTFGFPISPPSELALGRLNSAPAELVAPFPRAPWVTVDDVEYTLDFVVQNGSGDTVNVLVGLDGVNEFNVYTPGPEDLHQWERRFAIPAGGRERFSVTTLEMREIAVDLATVVNGAPNSNLVVQFENQSGRDDRVEPYIPEALPGLVGVVASLTTSAAASVQLELSVRAEDHGGRIPSRGAARWQLPAPTPFVPVVPEEEP